jgi:hypothetical protein
VELYEIHSQNSPFRLAAALLSSTSRTNLGLLGGPTTSRQDFQANVNIAGSLAVLKIVTNSVQQPIYEQTKYTIFRTLDFTWVHVERAPLRSAGVKIVVVAGEHRNCVLQARRRTHVALAVDVPHLGQQILHLQCSFVKTFIAIERGNLLHLFGLLVGQASCLSGSHEQAQELAIDSRLGH